MLPNVSLNDAQREAVMCVDGPLLVLAGAGSGKTRVLTYRIAHLVGDLGVAPHSILAITFTNKAAAEMRERLEQIIGYKSYDMWVSTFHSMCVRILRDHAHLLGFNRNFTVYDTQDSKHLYKEIYAELDIDAKRYPQNLLMSRISSAKNELLPPAEFSDSAYDPVNKTAAQVYERLQERLRAANAFDFDDLLFYTHRLLRTEPEVLKFYQDRFCYIHVDEYQDTNHAQYAITKLLAATHHNLMVVGDDDQSIYSWRGADIRNILDFESDYPKAHVVKLEQNYRSVGNVLLAANAVIGNNRHRNNKLLFTAREEGEKLRIYMASDEHDEGRWIASDIEKLRQLGETYNSIAVFYRTNAQSRILEDMLLRAGVPYRIVGGTRFFDRAEIRDVVSYLSVIANPVDDLAAKRIITVPRRGIGKTSISRIEILARDNHVSFMQAAELSLAENVHSPSVCRSVAGFVSFVHEMQDEEGSLSDLVEHVIDKSGLLDALRAEQTEQARGRAENIEEFLSVVKDFSETYEHKGAEFDGTSLLDFLEWLSLRTDLDTVTDAGEAVTLMTIHSAKGLEFDTVYVAGMEEGIFPHMNASTDPGGIEEERRLAYVAITRARRRLIMTYALRRQLYGQDSQNVVSRFISEIPGDICETTGVGSAGFSGIGWEKRGSRRGIAGSGAEAYRRKASPATGPHNGGVSRGASVVPKPCEHTVSPCKLSTGDFVSHKTFGRGKVIEVSEDTVSVQFENSGKTKKLLREFAPLTKLSK